MKNNSPNQYLRADEKILLNDEMMICNFDQVIITDKGITCITKKFINNAVDRYDFNNLLKINNKPGVQIINRSESQSIPSIINKILPEYCIIMNFTSGQLELELSGGNESSQIKSAGMIADVISTAVTGSPGNIEIPQIQTTKGGIFSNLKNKVIGAAGGIQQNCIEAENTKRISKCISCRAPLSGAKNTKVVCRYCDTEQMI